MKKKGKIKTIDLPTIASQISLPLNFTSRTIIPEEIDLFLKWDIEDAHFFEEMYLPLATFPCYNPDICYVVNRVIPENVKLFSTGEQANKKIERRLVFQRDVDDSFDRFHGFGVIQSSITENAYKYFKRVDEIANRERSFFEVPPAAIKGNIYNTEDEGEVVLGYFEVAKMDTSSVLIYETSFVLSSDAVVGENDCNRLSLAFLASLRPFCCFECLWSVGIPRECTD